MTDNGFENIAEFYPKNKTRPAQVDITRLDNRMGTRHPLGTVNVSGKREALKVAQAHNAKPWNF